MMTWLFLFFNTKKISVCVSFLSDYFMLNKELFCVVHIFEFGLFICFCCRLHPTTVVCVDFTPITVPIANFYYKQTL